MASQPDKFLWRVSRYKDQIETGDRVFIWRSIGAGSAVRSGIVAEARIVEPPFEREDDAVSALSWHDREKAGKAVRAMVSLLRVAGEEEIIRRDRLQSHPALRDLPIFQMASATNFRVSADHAEVLDALWSGQLRDRNRDRTADRLAPDLYARRREAGSVPLESPREQAAHAKTGRIRDRDAILASLSEQADRCADCGGVLGDTATLRPSVMLREDGKASIVHAACRAASLNPAAATYAEGDRTVRLRNVGRVERSPKARLIALGRNLRRNGGRLVCEACGQDHLGHPGVRPEVQSRLFDVHHVREVSDGARETNPAADLLVLCPLCHRLAHP